MPPADLLGCASIPAFGSAQASSGPSRKPPQLTPQQRAQYLQLVSSLNEVNGFGSPGTAAAPVGPGADRMPPRRCDGPASQGAGAHAARSDDALAGDGVQQVPPCTDLAQSVGLQVERMIMSAKRDSETKVSREVLNIKAKLEAIAEKARVATARVARLEASKKAMAKADLRRSLATSEEVWDQEVGMLKTEFWQMVQAHNHNADLMKIHTDSINDMQDHLAERAANPELEPILKHLVQIDRCLAQEQEAHRQQVQEFFRRLERLQGQIDAVRGSGLFAGGVEARLLGAAMQDPLLRIGPAFL